MIDVDQAVKPSLWSEFQLRRVLAEVDVVVVVEVYEAFRIEDFVDIQHN